jgi:light-harvesting complex 1 beta chain
MTDPPTTRPMSSTYASFTEPTSRPAPLGLSEDEARGFHRAFLGGFVFFTLVAAVAHWAVWQWRPWIPGVAGYEVRTAQTAPAQQAPAQVAYTVQR